jgi:hypothetical protein
MSTEVFGNSCNQRSSSANTRPDGETGRSGDSSRSVPAVSPYTEVELVKITRGTPKAIALSTSMRTALK